MKQFWICFILALASASPELKKPQQGKSAGLPGVNPKGFVNIDSKIYYVNPDTDVTVIEAVKFCNDLGMTLVSLETAQENSNVLNYTIDQDLGGDPFWTSGRPLVDTWIWSGSGQLFTDVDWLDGEPVPESENTCVYFNGIANWRATDCTFIALFMCE